MKKDCLLLVLIALLNLTGCEQPKAPEAYGPVPTETQLKWQELERYAFIHFSMNTFTDMEWGYGDKDPQLFNPSELDCRQWCELFKEAGMKGVILTAKHHDGFCLWPSAYTDYSVKQSPWRNGNGDLVRELADACKEYGLKLGIYLSPWDRNHKEYGTEAYITYFRNQLNELLTNYGDIFEVWFDGANGGSGYYGGADETRSVDRKTYYDWPGTNQLVKKLQPDAVIFSDAGPDVRWCGNEAGWVGETNWSTLRREEVWPGWPHYQQLQNGHEDGSYWVPAEVNVSIRPGWFYHAREDHQVKSLSHLVDLYYRSVGHNANFLLNFPVALNGKISPTDSIRAVEWYQTIQNDLKTNLLKGASVKASNSRGGQFKADKTNDGNWDSYWATEDGVTNATLTFTFSKPTDVNRLMIQEYIPLGQRVKAFTIETEKDGQWTPVEAADSTTTVGYKRIVRFQTVNADKIRINFLDARGPLCINNVEAFLAPALLTEPEIRRDRKDVVSIRVEDKNSELHYTTDGSVPTKDSPRYTEPFAFAQKGTIKAISYDRTFDKSSPVSVKELDIPASNYTVIYPKDEKTIAMFDGNGYTTFYLPKGKQEIEIQLANDMPIAGFRYVPNQGRDAGGHISNYQLFVNNKKVAEGEFSNIKHNPIEQEIRFPAIKGNKIRFVATRIVDNQPQAGIGEFSVITE